MTRLILLTAIVMFSGKLLFAQSDMPQVAELRKKIQSSRSDADKAAACLDLSAYYIFHENRLDAYPDSALAALKQGRQLADRSGNKDLIMAVSAMYGNYYTITGDYLRGINLCQKATQYYHSTKNYLRAAECFHWFGKSIDDSTAYLTNQKLQMLDSARALFVKAKLPIQIGETLQQIALCKAKQRNFDTAEAIMRQAISIYYPIDKARMLKAYDALAGMTEYQSDQLKQLKYRLELIEQMESAGDMSDAAYYYSKLAITYANLSMYEESLATILQAIKIAKQNKQYDDLYGDLSLAIFNYIKLGKPETALAFLFATKKEVPPQDLAHTVDLHDMLGKCYAALDEHHKAEEHFLTMIKLFERTKNTSLYDTRQQQRIDFIHYNQVIGDFYVSRKQFQKASVYYKRILRLPVGQVRPITLSKIHLMQFRVDSAAGRFSTAIDHYIIYKQLQDSLFNLAKSQQLQELKIKYETEKKVKDLELQQQYIVSLTGQTKLQQAELASKSLTRNITIISSLLLLVLAYLGYVFKQRHNLRLQAQQQEINAQNLQLRELLQVQQKLVTEKEWLLKEVHHRVKNNLHTIISLLETQAAFLSDDALTAIKNSQYRVYAMSLIHQKLYQFNNSTQINMGVYLAELLQYLQDSFGVTSRITVKANYNNVELDISQAIPIGLIFNEAITNAIKYAFPGNTTGVIEISMTKSPNGKVRLIISDNGVGLSPDWQTKINNTLGLKLMQGLSEDIQAKFDILTNNGTQVVVEFKTLGGLSSTDRPEVEDHHMMS